jgi:hypothetical protein
MHNEPLQKPESRRQSPWNKGKLIGSKPPLRTKDVWSIRTKLQVEKRTRDLAMFNLAIDSKLRGCDVVSLVSLRVEDVAPHGMTVDRVTVRQRNVQGTRVTPRPPHRSVRAPLCIRLLPRVPDGKSLVRPRVKDPRFREPVVSQLCHPSPLEVTLLTRYVPSLARQCPVCSSLDPSVQILEIALEVFLVVSPCQPVYAGRRVPSKFRERVPE